MSRTAMKRLTGRVDGDFVVFLIGMRVDTAHTSGRQPLA
jgi:hypothetical protein